MQLMGWFSDLGHWVANWWPIMSAYGVAGFWIAGLVAAAILIPWLSFNARLILIGIAVTIVLTTLSFTVGVKKGRDEVKAEQDQQLTQEQKNGEELRKDAADTVRAEPDSVRAQSPWNRDNWKVRKGD
jgi:type VI protein secretion system component VasK